MYGPLAKSAHPKPVSSPVFTTTLQSEFVRELASASPRTINKHITLHHTICLVPKCEFLARLLDLYKQALHRGATRSTTSEDATSAPAPDAAGTAPSSITSSATPSPIEATASDLMRARMHSTSAFRVVKSKGSRRIVLDQQDQKGLVPSSWFT